MAGTRLRGVEYPTEYIALRDIKAGSSFTHVDYLAPGQVRIIRTLARFEDTQQAATLLRLTPASFKAQVAILREKTGTHSMPQLILWAVKHGIIHVDASANGSHADPSLTTAEGHATHTR
jgi:DNA-binding CsgD family transcriptional regulator